MKKIFLGLFLLGVATIARAEDDHIALQTKDGLVVHWDSYYRDVEDNYCTNLAGGTACIPKADVVRVVTGKDARKIEKTVRSWNDREFYRPLEQAAGGSGAASDDNEMPGSPEGAKRNNTNAEGSGGMRSRAKGAVNKLNERIDSNSNKSSE